MSNIIYIQASPRGTRSHSLAVADAFIDTLKKADGKANIQTYNLHEMKLPELDNDTLVGKYNIMHGREFTAEEKDKWSAVEAVIEDFKKADKLVFAIPMWNFSIPYRLKHFMDIIAQPTYTFQVGPNGYEGLVNAKTFIAFSRGGAYEDGSPFDFQATYVKYYLGFIGITDIQTVTVQPTLAGGPETALKAREEAISKAIEIAKSF